MRNEDIKKDMFEVDRQERDGFAFPCCICKYKDVDLKVAPCLSCEHYGNTPLPSYRLPEKVNIELKMWNSLKSHIENEIKSSYLGQTKVESDIYRSIINKMDELEKELKRH